jgi:hypothetical protein
MKRKGASIWADLEIAPPASLDEVRAIEREHRLVLPEEFVEVVTGYSAVVSFHWSFEDMNTGEEIVVPPEGYRDISSGGGGSDWDLWNIGTLARHSEDLQGWMTTRTQPEEGSFGLVWQSKTAFMHAMNGDLYAFDIAKGSRDCPVIYLDHEHGSDHGIRLGLNFVDFITRWSNLGCPGEEIWQMMPFYDREQNLLMASGEVVENWKSWIDE